MKRIKLAFCVLLFVITATPSYATNYNLTDLTIKKLRAVGDYQGTTYDNTLELWFTTPVEWPVDSGCTTTYRVFIDKQHTHIISAAYLAFSTGKKVLVNVDNTLPIRSGACEVSFMDVLL